MMREMKEVGRGGGGGGGKIKYEGARGCRERAEGGGGYGVGFIKVWGGGEEKGLLGLNY